MSLKTALPLQFQSEWADKVQAHYLFLTRDPRFKRKQKHNKTIGLSMIVAFGLAMAYSQAQPWIIGTMLALLSGVFIWDAEYLAPKRLYRKLHRHLQATSPFKSMYCSYSLEMDGIHDHLGQVHSYSELQALDLGKDYLALVFSQSYIYLPPKAFSPGQLEIWVENLQQKIAQLPIHTRDK